MGTDTNASRENLIPEVLKEHIEELFQRIKPIVVFDGCKRYIEPVDLFEVSFIWNAKPAEEARGLKKLADITTYHTYGFYGLFKPSISEVLAQIPQEHLKSVVAFRILPGADIHGKYHVATTRLYMKE